MKLFFIIMFHYFTLVIFYKRIVEKKKPRRLEILARRMRTLAAGLSSTLNARTRGACICSIRARGRKERKGLGGRDDALCVFAEGGDNGRPEGEVGNEVAIHDVQVKPVRARVHHLLSLVSHAREVAGEHRRRNLSGRSHVLTFDEKTSRASVKESSRACCVVQCVLLRCDWSSRIQGTIQIESVRVPVDSVRHESRS